MSIQDHWEPTSGDRIKASNDTAEILILRRESGVFGYWHAITAGGESRTLTTEQMVKGTCEWLPWPHQIVSFLVTHHKYSMPQVLKSLATLSQYKREASFEDLCYALLAGVEEAAADAELRFSESGHGQAVSEDPEDTLA